jgi:hypothetical protein
LAIIVFEHYTTSMNFIKDQLKFESKESTFYRLAGFALLLYTLTFSLSIALSQIALVSFMVFVLSAEIIGGRRGDLSGLHGYGFMKEFYVPLFFWIIISLVSTIVSLDAFRSIIQLIKLSVYMLLPYLVCLYFHRPNRSAPLKSEIEKYVFCMFVVQAFAAIHTILSVHTGYEVRPKIPGALTESGQIALMVPFLLGGIFFLLKNNGAIIGRRLFSAFLFILLPAMIFAWYRKFPGVPYLVVCVLGIVSVLAILYFIVQSFRTQATSLYSSSTLLVPVLTVLIFAAFILNLKRGPWLAVIVEVIIFGLLFSRSTMLGFLFLMSLFSLSPPVYERIASFAEHFFIGGGRFDMWKLGFQLVERFPMGVGFANSSLMREFDPSLPILHRHMHNNILNIALETGIMGAIAYMWWFFHFILEGFKYIRNSFGGIKKASREGVYACLILISVIGWQVAGLVEYNFGDGEIRLIALVMIGFLFSLMCTLREGSSVKKQS